MATINPVAATQEYAQMALEAARVFRPSTPVEERALFAGRSEQLRMVIDAVVQPGQHAIVFGERGVGKTSLANVLPSFFKGTGEQILAPRVNCDLTDDFSSVWRKVFTEIQFARKVRGPGFGSVGSDEIDTLLAELPDRLTPDEIRKSLTLLGRGALLILIMDEFDRIPKGEATALFADTIKTLSDHSVAATLVLVGVADSVDGLLQEHESISRALVQVPLPRASKEEIEKIIENGLARLSLRIDYEGLRHIALLAQGLPHYAHLLGLNAARLALDAGSRRVDMGHVEAAIKRALSQAQQSIRNAYVLAITATRPESLYPQVLMSCALAQSDELGYFAPTDVRPQLSRIMRREYDIPSFARHLKEFSERRGPVLNKIGPDHSVRYRFANPLMQPYVMMHGVAQGMVEPLALVEALRTG